jgi:hypothetical protein
VRCISIDTCNGKHSMSLPMDYFKRLLEEACPNHAAQSQGVWHDEKIHDLRVSHLGSGAQRRARWERHGAFPHGKRHRDGSWGTPPVKKVMRV